MWIGGIDLSGPADSSGMEPSSICPLAVFRQRQPDVSAGSTRSSTILWVRRQAVRERVA